MQFRFIPLIPFTLLASVAAMAADVTELPDVVVTAARVAQTSREVVGDVTVISRKEIEQKTGQSLSDVLASQPGVQITSNGGVGKNTSIFLRGTNSSSTLVLIDGMRYSSATTGAAALQHLPLEQVERIEILRGPAASLYGADAMGGVIQVFTKQGGKKPQASIEVGLGSEGQGLVNARMSGTVGDTRYAFGVAHSETEGINVFADPAHNSYNPDKDGYSNSSVTLAVSQKLNAKNELGINLLAIESANQYDGNKLNASYLPAAQSYDYRETSRNGAASLWSNNQLTDSWLSRVQLGMSQDDSRDYSPVSATNLADQESRFTTRQTQASWQNTILVGPGTAIVGLETLEQRVSGNTAYAVDQRRINSVQAGYSAPISNVNIQANLRSDRNSQFGEHSSGKVGASWQIDPALQLGANLGSAFKAPTFNDLYYPDDGFGNKGNPNLKPETAFNREAFVRYQSGKLKTGVTFFESRIKNLIAWAPVDPNNSWGAWQPSNIGQAHIKGASFSAENQYQLLNYGARYDWLDARNDASGSNHDKRLIRRARQTGGLFAEIREEKQWSLRAELDVVGMRFEDEANTKSMGGYALTNLVASRQLDKEWTLNARLNNVFDRSYEQARGYSVPGLNGLLSLRWAM